MGFYLLCIPVLQQGCRLFRRVADAAHLLQKICRDVMGGGSAAYLGNLIQNQFLVARNWPLGAAFSVLLIIFTLVVLKAYSRVGDLDDLA